MQNLYEILGVARNADHETIRKAYKKLVKKYHPDRNPNDPKAQENFNKVARAYEFLGDPKKRKLYDQYGDMILNPNFDTKAAEEWNTQQQGFGDLGGFEQFFNGFTGGFSSGTQEYRGSEGYDRRNFRSSYNKARTSDFGYNSANRRQQAGGGFEIPERGTDIKVTVNVTLVEALKGCSKKITIRRPSRWKRGTNAGMTKETVAVAIPVGVRSGQDLRMKGKGNFGKGGGASGDLLVQVEVAPHPHLFREGADIYLNVPLSMQEAILGAQIEIPVLDGSVRVRIPAGVSTGQKLRLKGRGAKKKTGGNGDMYLILRPAPPASNDPRLIQLAKEIEEFYPEGGIRKDFKL